MDLLHPDDVARVDGYGAVVLGSAVSAGRVLPSVRGLLHRCADGLGETSVWVFWSGPVGVPLRPRHEPGEVERLLRRVRPRGRRVFAGRLSLAELGVAERALVRMLGVQPGDYRDLDDVRRWAWGITDELAAGGGQVLPDAGAPAAGGPADGPAPGRARGVRPDPVGVG